MVVPQNTPKWASLVGKPMVLGTTILGNPQISWARNPRLKKRRHLNPTRPLDPGWAAFHRRLKSRVAHPTISQMKGWFTRKNPENYVQLRQRPNLNICLSFYGEWDVSKTNYGPFSSEPQSYGRKILQPTWWGIWSVDPSSVAYTNDKLPSDMGIEITHQKDPYEQTSIMKCHLWVLLRLLMWVLQPEKSWI